MFCPNQLVARDVYDLLMSSSVDVKAVIAVARKSLSNISKKVDLIVISFVRGLVPSLFLMNVARELLDCFYNFGEQPSVGTTPNLMGLLIESEMNATHRDVRGVPDVE